MLHYAAPFAAVRWTNIHDLAHYLALGDVLSGPVAPAFGPGVADVELAAIDRPSQAFSHTGYWDADPPQERIDALRRALNLRDS